MPFGLPSSLPNGVFVIATTRTGTSLPALRQPYRVLLLEARSADNEWDMVRYLRSQVAEPELVGRINESSTDTESLSRHLLERCSGNWIYLHCVLSEIRYGLRHLNEVERDFYTVSAGGFCDAGGLEAPHVGPQRAVDQVLAGVQAHAP